MSAEQLAKVKDGALVTATGNSCVFAWIVNRDSRTLKTYLVIQ